MFRPGVWPLRFKVPMLVAILMVTISFAVSKIVLSRLESIQADQLHQLTNTYLEGLGTALQPHVIRHDVWEAFDVLDRARAKYAGLAVIRTVVVLPDESVLAASDPMVTPVGSKAPKDFLELIRAGSTLIIDEGAARARTHRRLSDGPIWLASIAAELDISALLSARRETLLTLIAVNALLTIAAAALGYAIVHRMLKPVGVLTSHLARAQQGPLQPITDEQLPREQSEFGRLLRRYNGLVAAVNEREALSKRLAEEEKAAMLGKLASGMAHEINNPLGGMFNAVAMIRRHGENANLRERAARLLERGLTGIRNIVRATLVIHKGGREQRALVAADIDDIRDLIQSEIDRRGLALEWLNCLRSSVVVDTQSVRQIALNLLLNACAASPASGVVKFKLDVVDGRLVMEVVDHGPGLAEIHALVLLADRPTGVPSSGGLGLWSVRRLLDQLGGRATVVSETGCEIRIEIPLQAAEAIHATA